MSANPTFKDVHIETIQHGDIVEHDGKLSTVGNQDIKHGGFMGSTLFGDSYHLGSKPVRKVVGWQ